MKTLILITLLSFSSYGATDKIFDLKSDFECKKKMKAKECLLKARIHHLKKVKEFKQNNPKVDLSTDIEKIEKNVKCRLSTTHAGEFNQRLLDLKAKCVTKDLKLVKRL